MGFDLQLRYEHPDLGDDPQKDERARADMALARQVGTALKAFYPGHPWFVEVSHAQGVVLISIPALTAENRYVVHIANLKGDPSMKAVMRGAGELLERFNLPRSGFDAAHFIAALKSQPIGRGHVPN